MHYTHLNTPLGTTLIAADENAVKGLWFEGQKYEQAPADSWVCNPENTILKKTVEQINQYFAGESLNFTLTTEPEGTDFQKLVWDALCSIPSGQTVTYGELAHQLGKPSAVRAVSAAIGKNPISIVIPCHRVIGANGSLTGYAGGLNRKQSLLALEGAIS